MAHAHDARLPRWQVLLAFALALAVRIVVSRVFPLDEENDPDSYLAIGWGLRWDGTYGSFGIVHLGTLKLWPTAYRPPLYSLLVAGCTWLEDGKLYLLAAVHDLLGAATAALTFVLGRKWGLPTRGAWLAAALVAIDPILLKQSVLPMTETLATFLSALGLFVLTWTGDRPRIRSAAIAGIVLALAELCRPTFLMWLFPCGLALATLTRPLRARVVVVGTFFLAAAIVIAPWVVRNYRVFDRPIITTTHGGYTLRLANNRWFYQHLAAGYWFVPWDSDELQSDPPKPPSTIYKQEVSTDRYHYSAALSDIRAEPGMFLVSCVYRLSRLWGVCPMATEANESLTHRLLRYAVAGFYLAEFALAAWGAWGIGRKWLQTPWLWGLLLVLSFTAVHTVYWTDMRMRAPLVPVIALAAGAGLARMGCWRESQPVESQSLATPSRGPNLP
jgi:hypothetical protein